MPVRSGASLAVITVLLLSACATAPSPPGPTDLRGSQAQATDASVALVTPEPTAAATVGAWTGAPLPAQTTPPTTKPTTTPTARPTTGPKATPKPTIAPVPIPPLSACPIFPSSNVWNKRVDGLPVASNSDTMIKAIGLGSSLHPDFSAAGGYGIPFNLVGTATGRSKVVFDYADESDAGPYPIPAKPKVEGGSDRHILMIDTNACRLYELFAAAKVGSSWTAGSGAIWDLKSNALRPDGWTSGDAAGLPIFPGLVRYAEVAAGEIRHAIRFTAASTCNGYIYPARHKAGSGLCTTKPPMGLRVRLKASVDISGYGPQSRVILRALQQYGMLLADNGSPWYITGATDSHWNDDELHGLGGIKGADFEVVDTTGFVNG
ncbi:MAG: hypothetical protein ABI573_09610 [Chloroflexota bacterium]